MKTSYMPQLDGLRAIAIAAVMFSHFTRPDAFPTFIAIVPWGPMGVWLFFVLSGFLITGILLDSRDLSEHKPERGFALRQFYVRRFLRIFPLYYGVVFAAIALDVEMARDLSGWLLTYTANIYVTLANDWPGHFSHFWTLAVEEQFYLVWPWIILFAPKRRILLIIVLAIISAPIYRLLVLELGSGGLAMAVFTVSCFDSLGMGALLAVLVRSETKQESLSRLMIAIVLPIGLVWTLVLLAAKGANPDFREFDVLFASAAATVFMPIVYAASIGSGWLRWLSIRPVAYLGKISYGIYVYHPLVPLAFQPLYQFLGVRYFEWNGALWPHKDLLYVVLSVLLTILVAALSWHLFESQINRQKRHFPYSSDKT